VHLTGQLAPDRRQRTAGERSLRPDGTGFRYGETPISVRSRGHGTRLCVRDSAASSSLASRRGNIPCQRSISAGGCVAISRRPNKTQVLVVLLPDWAPKIGHTLSSAHALVIRTRV